MDLVAVAVALDSTDRPAVGAEHASVGARRRMTWTQGTCRDITRALAVLVGASLIRSARFADMEAFRFGPLIDTESRTGDPRRVAAYALHVQCPWRIVFEDRIVVGYSDMSDPPLGTDRLDFDPNSAPITRRDELMTQFFASRLEQPRIVVACTASPLFDLVLELDDGCRLELFPENHTGAEESEFWRFMLPDGRHLVVSADGAEVSTPDAE